MNPSKDEQILRELLEQRILILDGAMGTMIQSHHLDETAFRGPRFATHSHDLAGNNDLLCLTQPELIKNIHRAYYQAGADIIETNSFNSTRSSQADYRLEDITYELNLEAAKIAREVCDEMIVNSPERPRFVAGVLGPTSKTASLSPDVNDPGFRNTSYDELVEDYSVSVAGLIDGGVHIILIETAFDTLNAKAAIFATHRVFEQKESILPVIISGTITDASGRTLSGQTVEAFCNSIAHAKALAIGFNCAMGAEQLRPHIAECSSIVTSYVSTHPNAGLPNEFGEYDQTPEEMASIIGEFAEQGFVNIVGGCCGTTPDHIRAIAEKVSTIAPRGLPKIKPACRLSGLEAFNIDDESLFVNIGERTNITGSERFAQLIRGENYDEALDVARQQVEAGAQIIDVNMDEGMLDSKAAMETFLKLIAAEPEISKVPLMIDSSKWEIIEAGLKCCQGKTIVNSISLKEGEEDFLQKAGFCLKYGAAVVVMSFDEKGQADTLARKKTICQRSYDLLVDKLHFPATTMPSISSSAAGSSKLNCQERLCQEASAMCLFHFAVITPYEKLSTRYFFTTLSRQD